ncbi:Signal transduction histidine kinase [Mariniphaga anaerophila]|uniref:histidine kinase n=1 Tax=Mariniphaga anaerophila TaxID=1484053 RepID=A0A1M4SJD3_9BACT|nr:LytS/YhcK type 5TM receptor domain-containing protein [Mariniphaga anaerophila]SHE32374.1 Signal transduction histidine kinase [Mariniphaga anaerophila]
MDESIIVGLVQNIAILLTFALLYKNFWLKNDKPGGVVSQIVSGIVLSVIATILMFTPWEMAVGLVFDTRSVMLAVAGVFLGPVPTLIAIVLSSVIRYLIGGTGMAMGIAVIVSSGLIGIAWGELRKNWKRINRPVEFLLLGLVVHIVMLGTIVFLPYEREEQALRAIILPVFLIYAPGTMLLGMLLAAQKRNYNIRVEKEELFKKEHRLSNELMEKQRQLNFQLDKYAQLNKEYKAQNIELTKAKEKAEESDLLKSAFLANLSHEIRTPMNAIMGFADLLKIEETDSKTRKKYIRIIHDSGDYLLSIINDIVEFSHIEAGQVDIKKTEIDVARLLEDIYHSFVITADARENLSFKLKKPKTPLKGNILLDEVKIRQVIVNLINNALKYTEQGEISFGYEISSPSQISFFVKDTGIGIAPENHQVIFERFRQLDMGHLRAQSGSGLGLPITKAYTEMMGGTISVESEKGKGAEFRVAFPLDPAKKSNESSAEKTATAKAGLASKGKKLVLVAEDEDINWYYIEQVLSKYNYSLIRANNGTEAVEICKNNSLIDIVLMDIKMPEMDGFEALERIRKINPKLPVIAQTAYALSDEVERIKFLFDDYITKPINRQLLIEKIVVAKTSSL